MHQLFGNRMYNLLNNFYWRFVRFISTALEILNCSMRGISLGKKCSFYGLVKFTKGSKSTISIGDNCTFRSMSTSNLIGVDRPCIISAIGTGYSCVTIGNCCGFSGTVIGCFNTITIGNNVRCGANTLITDSDWHEDDPRVGNAKPVIIKDNVWLGIGVIVMKGVTIGENTIIGAGSVVVKSIPANVIAAGNPCKVIRSLEHI